MEGWRGRNNTWEREERVKYKVIIWEKVKCKETESGRQRQSWRIRWTGIGKRKVREREISPGKWRKGKKKDNYRGRGRMERNGKYKRKAVVVGKCLTGGVGSQVGERERQRENYHLENGGKLKRKVIGWVEVE